MKVLTLLFVAILTQIAAGQDNFDKLLAQADSMTMADPKIKADLAALQESLYSVSTQRSDTVRCFILWADDDGLVHADSALSVNTWNALKPSGVQTRILTLDGKPFPERIIMIFTPSKVMVRPQFEWRSKGMGD